MTTNLAPPNALSCTMTDGIAPPHRRITGFDGFPRGMHLAPGGTRLAQRLGAAVGLKADPDLGTRLDGGEPLWHRLAQLESRTASHDVHA